MKEFKSKDLLKQWPTILRMPFFYLSKLLKALSPYLLTRPFHGIYTIYWRHKVFSEIVYNKYLSNYFIISFKNQFNYLFFFERKQ